MLQSAAVLPQVQPVIKLGYCLVDHYNSFTFEVMTISGSMSFEMLKNMKYTQSIINESKPGCAAPTGDVLACSKLMDLPYSSSCSHAGCPKLENLP